MRLQQHRHPESIALRIYQKYSCKPDASNIYFGKYCKYQLLRYKAWSVDFADCLGSEDVTNEALWIDAWSLFLESEEGQLKVPDWNTALDNAILYERDRHEHEGDSSDSSADDLGADDEDRNPHLYHQDDYMRNMGFLEPHTSQDDGAANEEEVDVDDGIEYWSAGRTFLLDAPLLTFLTEGYNLQHWLQHQKDLYRDIVSERRRVYEDTLNEQQRKVYGLVQRFIERDELDEEFLMRVEGIAGTGKFIFII